VEAGEEVPAAAGVLADCLRRFWLLVLFLLGDEDDGGGARDDCLVAAGAPLDEVAIRVVAASILAVCS
jgi:hypothetical protein